MNEEGRQETRRERKARHKSNKIKISIKTNVYRQEVLNEVRQINEWGKKARNEKEEKVKYKKKH